LAIRDISFSCRSEMGGAASVAALGAAASVLRDGRARYVLVVSGWAGYSRTRLRHGGDAILARLQRTLPHRRMRVNLDFPAGLVVPLQFHALHASRWMNTFEIDRDALGIVAVTHREHAQLNPRVSRRRPELSPEEYAGSEVVCWPLTRLDC